MKDLRRGALLVAGIALVALAPTAFGAGPYQYFAVTPCRFVDTRNPNGLNGGPVIDASAPQRDFQVQGKCGIPVGAKAVSINVTVVAPPTSFFGGWFAFWPSGQTRPVVSTINFTGTDPALANGAIIPLSTNASDMSSFFGGSGLCHLVLDVTGYFQ